MCKKCNYLSLGEVIRLEIKDDFLMIKGGKIILYLLYNVTAPTLKLLFKFRYLKLFYFSKSIYFNLFLAISSEKEHGLQHSHASRDRRFRC